MKHSVAIIVNHFPGKGRLSGFVSFAEELVPALARLREVTVYCGSRHKAMFECAGRVCCVRVHPALNCKVDTVDVRDNRVVTEGYCYQQVGGTRLPFEDAVFDVVLTNHVIERVGNERAQRAHLAELHRMFPPDGVGYLAVHNRWMVVEPRYRMILLSWLRQRLADVYVRIAKKGGYYDCRPLAVSSIESMLSAVGFTYKRRRGDALLLTYEPKSSNSAIYRWLLKLIPSFVFAALRRISPTLIYTLELTSPVEDRAPAGHV